MTFPERPMLSDLRHLREEVNTLHESSPFEDKAERVVCGIQRIPRAHH